MQASDVLVSSADPGESGPRVGTRRCGGGGVGWARPAVVAGGAGAGAAAAGGGTAQATVMIASAVAHRRPPCPRSQQIVKMTVPDNGNFKTESGAIDLIIPRGFPENTS